VKIKELIDYLNNVENKEQEVYISNLDFTTGYPIQDAVEIKSSTDNAMYSRGVNLIADI
jgi:hypothetical protein